MKVAIVAEDMCVAEVLAQKLERIFREQMSFEAVSVRGDFISVLKSKAPAFLVTIDLAGFDRVTLTDNIAYNLLDCKQLHVILKDGLKNEECLAKNLSIAMFFACVGKKLKVDLLEKYPNISWLECMEKWNMSEKAESEGNVKKIGEILERVICECMHK